MNERKIARALICLLVLCAMLLNLSACFTKVKAESLMEGIEPRHVEPMGELQGYNAAVTDFALRLFKASHNDGESTLISPLSVLSALAMTANGARGNTLAEMEDVLGLSTEELNLYLYTYMNSLSSGNNARLNLANSIWFRDDESFVVNPDFLQTNADFYGADIYKTPFDKGTLRDINNWVKRETDGMIPKVLDDIPANAVMYLVNALAFEAEWERVYKSTQVRDGIFTGEDGTTQAVELMYSGESVYLEDEGATGFIKYYKGRKYAFAALLPNEGVSVSEYVNSLDGAALAAMLGSAENEYVSCAIPKFEFEFERELGEVLRSMGMSDAFELEDADFSELGRPTSPEENIFISRVIHKTYIEVAEKGTKAGAATVVEMTKDGTAHDPERKEVILDRPFVYMLIDCENNIPFFIGALMEI